MKKGRVLVHELFTNEILIIEKPIKDQRRTLTYKTVKRRVPISFLVLLWRCDGIVLPLTFNFDHPDIVQ